MGTRNLVAVVHDGQFKVAQYGQWDGYPSGQGVIALNFLREQFALDGLSAFSSAVNRCYFLSSQDIQEIEPIWREQMQAIEWGGVGDYAEHGKKRDASYRREGSWTHLSRDVGAKILDVILKRPDETIGLQDSKSFAGDGLFCEWAWVIDLDTGKFEAYEGFKKATTPPDSRFPSGADWLDKSDYGPVHMVGQWDIASLPREEEFLAHFENEDEEAAAA